MLIRGLFALIGLFASFPAIAQKPEQLPDLDVLYIERTPRYPGYALDYGLRGSEGVPILIDNKTRKPLTPEQAKKVKRWPSTGESVTFTAHVQNRGNAPAPGWEYVWTIDRVVVSRGVIAGPQPVGKEFVVQQIWRWQPGRHVVKFQVDPLCKVRDLNLMNNSREDATDAWSLIWAVDRQVYESFGKHRNFLGTTSFEDWAQWHIDHMNRLFDESPITVNAQQMSIFSMKTANRQPNAQASPPGSSMLAPDSLHPGPQLYSYPFVHRPRIRCDKVVVVDDTEKLWDNVLGPGVQALDAGYDGAWGFGRRTDEQCAEWAANVDWGLIHEWGHQLGLTDEYALDRPAFLNLAPDANGDPLLIGHMSMLQGHMMHGHGPTTFSAECMAALLTQPGRRRGYYGDYYYCIPRVNKLVVEDSKGKRVAGAKVAFWQDSESKYSGEPVFAGVTDEYGAFTMPNRRAPHVTTELGYTQRDNPFGKINVVGPGDVFFVRIQARGHTEYTWMEIAEFNLAYWSGNTDKALYVRKTRIPPAGAPAAPVELKADVERDSVRLTWKPVPGATGYHVYHGPPDQYKFEPDGEIVTNASYSGKLGPGALHRYAVTAVGQGGVESGFSNVAGAMHFARPWGIVVTRDGRRLIRDAQYENTVLQKPDGNTVGLVGSVHYHFEGSFDHAIDPNGRILTAKWPDGYNPKSGFKVQDANLNLVYEYLQPEGSAPGQVRKPMGIGSDSNANVFIADTINNRVQQFSPDGKFVRIIGAGELRLPMKVAFDKRDNLYVADSGNNRVAIYDLQPDGSYKLARSLTGIKEPDSVLVDPAGRVFVGANREAGVHLFDATGRHIWKYAGTPDVPLTAPRGMALDLKGNLLVVDDARLRIWTIKPP